MGLFVTRCLSTNRVPPVCCRESDCLVRSLSITGELSFFSYISSFLHFLPCLHFLTPTFFVFSYISFHLPSSLLLRVFIGSISRSSVWVSFSPLKRTSKSRSLFSKKQNKTKFKSICSYDETLPVTSGWVYLLNRRNIVGTHPFLESMYNCKSFTSNNLFK